MKKSHAVAILALAGLVGCGGSDEDSYTLVKVTGTITKNGKPLPNADVSFVPNAGNSVSTPGADRTGPEGNYMLRFKGRTGVAVGKYNVTITPAFEVPAGANVPDVFKNDPVMLQTAQKARAQSEGKGSAAAKKEVVKSEFPAEVEQGKSNTIDFDVKS
jgi:hypothetical protein